MVRLITCTADPDRVCAVASNACVSHCIRSVEEAHTTEEVGRSLRHAIGSGHESVLEHAAFTFAVEGISRACSHQLVRHRMASFSQQSQRYVRMSHFEYTIPGSVEGKGVADLYRDHIERAEALYDELIAKGIPPEDARYILPEATHTNIVITMNARELRHFFSLRCCKRAQWEIRELAETMLELCKREAPEIFADAGPPCKRDGCRELLPCWMVGQ